MPFLFDFILVAADNGAGDEADFVHLGNVDAAGGVFAFVVEPVLFLRVLDFRLASDGTGSRKTNLALLELFFQFSLLLLACKLRVLGVDLGSKLVDVRL